MQARALLNGLTSLAAAAVLSTAAVGAACAGESDARFFSKVAGEWAGPGEIVAGKFKGTKFTCSFTGENPKDKIGMTLDGGCRVGLFTQKMSANVVHKGGVGYRGTFMDGAIGEGLDVVGGNVTGQKVVLSLNRNDLHGAMLARLPDDDTLHVTVSVRVNSEMIPVIGMNLKRVDASTVGSVSR